MTSTSHIYYLEWFDRYNEFELEDSVRANMQVSIAVIASITEHLQDTMLSMEELECIRWPWKYALIINLIGKQLPFNNLDSRLKKI